MNNIHQQIVKNLIKAKLNNQADLNLKIRTIAGSFKIAPPEKIKLLSAYHKLLKHGSIKKQENLEKLLKKAKGILP